MKKTLIILLIVVMAGCDSVSEMREFTKKPAIAEEYIKDRYGWDSEISFKMNNDGRPEYIRLELSISDVRGMQISELEKIANKMLDDVFETEPYNLYVQIAVDRQVSESDGW